MIFLLATLILSSQFSLAAETTVSKPAPSDCNVQFVDDFSVPLYYESNEKSDKLNHLKFDQPVCVLKNEGTWVQVKTIEKSPIVGWIAYSTFNKKPIGIVEARKNAKQSEENKNYKAAIKWAKRVFDLDDSSGSVDELRGYYLRWQNSKVPDAISGDYIEHFIDEAIKQKLGHIEKITDLPKNSKTYSYLKCDTLKPLPSKTLEDILSNIELPKLDEAKLRQIACFHYRETVDTINSPKSPTESCEAGPQALNQLARLELKKKNYINAEIIASDVIEYSPYSGCTIGDVAITFQHESGEIKAKSVCARTGQQPKKYSSPEEFIKVLRNALSGPQTEIADKVFPCTNLSDFGGGLGSSTLSREDIVRAIIKNKAIIMTKSPSQKWNENSKSVKYNKRSIEFYFDKQGLLIGINW